MLRIDRGRDALVLTDIQNDFCPRGSLAVPGGDTIIPLVNALSRRFDHVAATQDWHPPGHQSFASSHAGRKPFETIPWRGREQVLWPDHCVQSTPGAAFAPGLDLSRAGLIVRKGTNPRIDSYSAFRDNDESACTGLLGALRERGAARVFLVGLATDFCVYYSAMDARREGFEVVVIMDGCRAIDLAGSLAAAEAAMREAGVTLIESGELN